VGGRGTIVALVFLVRRFNLLRGEFELVQKNVAGCFDQNFRTLADKQITDTLLKEGPSRTPEMSSTPQVS
jgi:hypothetical protein